MIRIFAGSIAATIGAAAAWRYHELGLTLSHYDARGHLIVARRIIDNLTPGWEQIGAIWLPLPHLLNMLPVQIDAFYRNGASAVAISVLSFVLATAALAWLVRRLTGSDLAALAASAVFVLNPNVVYLQATPMTEPLLLGLLVIGVALLVDWTAPSDGATSGAPRRSTAIGVVLALACLTRYEAWPVTYAALAAAAWAKWRRRDPLGRTLRDVGVIALYPTVAIVGFCAYSKVVIGAWFVSGGFFVPTNKSRGLPMVAVNEIVWGVRELSGPLLSALAVAGIAALLGAGLFVRRRAGALVGLALAATAAVPWVAFLEGHPYRIRYMVPLIAAQAVAAGVAAGWASSFVTRVARGRVGSRQLALLRVMPAVLVAGIALYELRPFDLHAPMVVEAQWDRVNVGPRRHVTACLKARYEGEAIMASMGSLGHYMQEMSLAGFNLRDFLHEGNGEIWQSALKSPRPYAGWILIEEKAEGGDMLYKRAREHPDFLEGYSRICDGAGVALYERVRTEPGT